ncbi:MAG: peptidase C14 [Desertifilum sp. SIO1I2]|nr:peptidase C14 [Desertifilum sp. SIO1I2]
MGKTFAIAIGINQYQHFQPLNYAQQDAQALWDLWTQRLGIPSNQCFLLTDSAQAINGQSTYPERETLQNWLDYLSGDGPMADSPLQAGDRLWCFFSGYGVSHSGQDYLMPVDGNPENIETTGISMRWLFTCLQHAPSDRVFVFLDMNRPASLQSGSLLGTHTATLAREMGIPTFLSCQPSEISHETADLRQGIFTQAVLEALRSEQVQTLAELEDYLQKRVPELCDHHLQPIQNPLLVVSPPEKIHQPLLPIPGEVTPASSATVPFPTTLKPAESAIAPKPIAKEPAPQDDSGFWKQLILACFGIAALLVAGVFLTNRTAFTGNPQAPQVATPGDPDPGAAPVATDPGVTAVVPPVEPGDPPLDPEPTAVDPGQSPAPPEASPSPVPVAPATVPTTAPAPARPAAASPTNQELLGRARTALGSNASDYVRAIAIARQIRPGESLYQQAQIDIDRWSQAILDIAEGRARRGQFAAAISAARLVPTDRPAIHRAAQNAIARWEAQGQQQQANQQILSQANQSIRAGNAESYVQAINTARRIPQGQPQYFEAQQRINQWSRNILQLAYAQVSGGSLENAIRIASLVPENTEARTEAQNAIAVWRNRQTQR